MTTAEVPGGLVSSVVDLVDTGPVLLGSYTSAELTAVDAVVDFLEARPSDEVLAEAVRSLAARELLVASDGDEQLQVLLVLPSRDGGADEAGRECQQARGEPADGSHVS